MAELCLSFLDVIRVSTSEDVDPFLAWFLGIVAKLQGVKDTFETQAEESFLPSCPLHRKPTVY